MSKNLFVILLFIVVHKTIAQNETDYCKIECENVDDPSYVKYAGHTMCEFSPEPAGTCKDVALEFVGFSEESKQKIVETHNSERRRNVEIFGILGNITDSVWDEELATIAQRWANQCVYYANDPCRDVIDKDGNQVHVGQRIDNSYYYVGPDEIVKKLFTVGRPSMNRLALNPEQADETFSILIQSTRIGCGQIQFRTKNAREEVGAKLLTVCNYAPVIKIKSNN